MNIPDFDLKLAFVDVGGTEVSISSLDNVFDCWSSGFIGRDVVIKPHDGSLLTDLQGALIARLLEGNQDDKDQIASVFAKKVSEVVQELSWANAFLSSDVVDLESNVRLDVTSSWAVSCSETNDGCVQAKDTTKRGSYLYPPMHNLYNRKIDFSLSELRSGGWGYIRNYFRNVIQELVDDDNALFAFLLHQAAASHATYCANVFTPYVYSEVRNDLWNCKIPHTALIAPTLDVLDTMFVECADRSDFSPCNLQEGQMLSGCVGHISGVPVICEGFPHDPLRLSSGNEYFFFVGPAHVLGSRVYKGDMSGTFCSAELLGSRNQGFFFNQHAYTTILNSNAVASVILP